MCTARKEDISSLGDKFETFYAECDDLINRSQLIKNEAEIFLQSLNEGENPEKHQTISNKLHVIFDLMEKLKYELKSVVKLLNPMKPIIPHISINTTKSSLIYLTGDNPWNFWLQESALDIKGLYKGLIEKFENRSLESYSSLPPVGEYVCYIERRKVFRGIVIQHLEKDRLKIIDIDTSCLKVLSLNKVYKADEEVCGVTALAIKCCLSEDFDSSFYWSPDLGSLFTNNLKSGKLHVKILKELPGYPPQFYVTIIVENEDEEGVLNINEWICDRVLPELKKLHEDGVETSCEFLSSNALDPYFQDYSNSENNFQFQVIPTKFNGTVRSDKDLNNHSVTDSHDSPHLDLLLENFSPNALENRSALSKHNKSDNEKSFNSSLSVAELLERSLSSSHLPTVSDKQRCDTNCPDTVLHNSQQNKDKISEKDASEKFESNEFVAFIPKLNSHTSSSSESTVVGNTETSDLPREGNIKGSLDTLDEVETDKTVKSDTVSAHTPGTISGTDIREILLDEEITNSNTNASVSECSDKIKCNYDKEDKIISDKKNYTFENNSKKIPKEDKFLKPSETEVSFCSSEGSINKSLVSTSSNAFSNNFSTPNLNQKWLTSPQPPNLISQCYKPLPLQTFSPPSLIPFQQTTQTMTGFWPLQSSPHVQFYPQQPNPFPPLNQWANYNLFQELNVPYPVPNVKAPERFQLPFNQWSPNVIDTNCSTQQKKIAEVFNNLNVNEKRELSSSKETNKTDVSSLSEPTSSSARNSGCIDKENFHVKLKPPISLMKPNENLLLMMAHIESPSEFYVHVVTKNNLYIDKPFSRLKEQMSTHYSEAQHIANKDFEDIMNKYGKFCACKWPEDNHWYRVEVLNWSKGDQVFVYFVDYGNHDEVPLSSIQPLADQFTKLAMMAQPCHLANVHAADSPYNAWSDEAINFFVGLFEFDTAYNAIVVPSGCKYSSNSLSIILFKHDDKRDLISVNDLMVAEGFAITKIKSSLCGSTNSQIDSETDDSALHSSLKSTNIDEDEEWEKFNPLEEDYHSSSNAFSIDQENVNVAVTGYKGKDQSDVCRFFAKNGRCWKTVCRKKHEFLYADDVPDKSFNDIKLPNPDDVVLVKITYFCSTNRFFAQLQNPPSDDDQEETLETLSNFMNKRSTIREMKPLDEPPLVGQLVIAKSSDGYWFRARVLGPPEDGEVEVMFVDYGTDESVFEQDIRKMEPTFLHLPFQAVECFLAGIGASDDKKINQKAVDVLRKHFSGTTLYAHIKLSFDSLSRLEVFLRDEENMDVGNWLFKQGLCKKITS